MSSEYINERFKALNLQIYYKTRKTTANFPVSMTSQLENLNIFSCWQYIVSD